MLLSKEQMNQTVNQINYELIKEEDFIMNLSKNGYAIIRF